MWFMKATETAMILATMIELLNFDPNIKEILIKFKVLHLKLIVDELEILEECFDKQGQL